METKTITPEMYEKLKAPLPSEAVKPHPTKTYLSSIKAIFVTERLNDVFGCGAWTTKVEEVSKGDKGMVVVKVIFQIPEYGVYYESFGGNDNGGEGSKNFDLGDAYKGATTDAITKIGSFMGIGIEVFKGHGNIPGNNAPIPDEVPQIPKTTTKPYITSPIITLMIQDVKEGKIQVSSADALIEMARKKYIVARDWAEKEIRAKYDAVDKSKQITN